MNAETFCEYFATFADAPNGIAKLRELILQLAVQGKLVSQDANDEPGNLLRLRIIAKRQQLIDSGEFTAFATDTEWPDGALPHTLPNGWEWIRLGELGGFLGGGTPSKERAEFWNGKIPWVSPKDMKRPYMDDAIDHVTPLGVENSSGKMIPKSSLLMVVRGMILAHSFPVALAMRELTINQDMKALQLALPELGEYLLRCCTACKSRMLESVERSSHGTCRLPTEAVANFPIPLPPLAEQRRIVEKVDQLLGLCDELAARQVAQREKRQRLVGATLDCLVSTRNPAEFPTHAHRLRKHFDQLFDTPTTIPQLRQTILQLAVQGQLVPQDPDDEPVSQLLDTLASKRHGEGNGKRPRSLQDQSVESPHIPPHDIPQSWAWTRFDQVATIASSLVQPSAFSESPHVAPDNIEKGTGRLLPYQTVGEDGVRSSNHQFFAGQILYSKIRPNLAKAVIVDFDGLCSADMYPINAHIDPAYLLRFMLSQTFLGMAVRNDTRVAMPKINQVELNAILVPVPPLAEQKRIVTKVTELLSLCDALEAKLTQAESASTQLLSAAVHSLLGAGEQRASPG